MDVTELQAHARRYGHWNIQLTKNDLLECYYEWSGDYTYYLNDVRVTSKVASDVLEKSLTLWMEHTEAAYA